MKHLKRFNENTKHPVKQYTDDELEELSYTDRRNYKTVISHLCSEWNIPKDIITAVVVAMGGSYDESSEYLSDMDAYDFLHDPAGYWDEWCRKYDIEHEIGGNPFIY